MKFDVTQFVKQVVDGTEQERHAQLSQFDLAKLSSKQQSTLYTEVCALKNNNEKESASYPQVLFLYALLKYRGIGCESSTSKTIETLDIAISLGNPYALTLRAMLHENPKKGVANKAQAIALYERAIELGCTWAWYYHANLLLKGTQDEQCQGLLLLDKAVALDDPQALHMRALLHEKENQCELARELYEQAMAQGHRESKTNRANFYLSGKAGNRDVVLAVKLYKEAKEMGSTAAMVNLGVLHLKGIGVTQDVPRAISLLQSAADRNNPAAMIRLAEVYRQGQVPNLTLPQSIEHATHLLDQAIALNDPEAMKERGKLCIESQRARAIEWFEKSWALGHVNALTQLAKLYKDSRDPQKAQKGMEYLDQALALGDSGAMVLRASMYLDEKDVAKEQMAIELLQRAIATANSDAMCVLAEEYQKKGDQQAQIALLERAMNLGNAEATRVRAILYEEAGDDKRAEELLKMAIVRGDIPALEDLGIFYDNNNKKEEAIKFYDKAIAHGSAYAMVYRAQYYLEDKKEAEAEALFAQAEKADKDLPWEEYVEYLLNKGNRAKAISLLDKGVKADKEEAIVKRAELHREDKEYQTAFLLMDKAMNLESDKAKALAKKLSYPNNTNPISAIAYTEYLMAKGDAEAYYLRGLQHQKGFGAPINRNEAYGCFREAIAKGWAQAMVHLGLIYLNEDGNPAAAAQLFDQAIAKGYQPAVPHRARVYKTAKDLVKYSVLHAIDYELGSLQLSKDIITPKKLNETSDALKFLETLPAKWSEPIKKEYFDAIGLHVVCHYRVMENFNDSVRPLDEQALTSLFYILEQHARATYTSEGVEQVMNGLSYKHFATPEGVGTLKKLAKLKPEANYWLGMYYMNAPQSGVRSIFRPSKEMAMTCFRKAASLNNTDAYTRGLAQEALGQNEGTAIENKAAEHTSTVASTSSSATSLSRTRTISGIALNLFPEVAVEEPGASAAKKNEERVGLYN